MTNAKTTEKVKKKGQTPPPGYSKGINDYLNHYVAIADAKAAAFLAGNLIALTIVIDLKYLENFSSIVNFLALSFFALSSILSTIIFFPRLPKGRKGTIFWEDIRSYDVFNDYLEELKFINEIKAEEEYASQNYYISKVLHTKHYLLRWSILFFLIGVLLAFIAYLAQ
jgi:hypothetical protein